MLPLPPLPLPPGLAQRVGGAGGDVALWLMEEIGVRLSPDAFARAHTDLDLELYRFGLHEATPQAPLQHEPIMLWSRTLAEPGHWLAVLPTAGHGTTAVFICSQHHTDQVAGAVAALPARVHHLKVYDPNSAELPAVGCQVLQTLDLAGCAELRRLPALASVASLTTLCVPHTRLSMLPESLGTMTALVALDLGECAHLTSVPPCIGNLARLRSLLLNNCWALTSLPNELGQLVHLEELDLTSCAQLRALPSTLGALVALRWLRLSGCMLASLPNMFSKHHRHITALDLSSCRRLEQLPPSICKLPNLSQLWLANCRRLAALPPALGNLETLQILDLDHCRALLQLPASLSHLLRLTTVSMLGSRLDEPASAWAQALCTVNLELQTWREHLLLLVLAGRRTRRPRIPPELWLLVDANLVAFRHRQLAEEQR